jgi:geranylgeranyl pyrophosphate synthase
LFALPVRGAAQLVGLRPDEAENLARTFTSIGILYQLQDDLLDLFDAKGGGSRGSDIYEGRISAVVLTHLDLHPEDAGSVFRVLGKARERTTPEEVSTMIGLFVEGGATQQLIRRIDLLASELLASDSLTTSREIHAVARELVQRVLAPLEKLRGAVHE